MVYTYDPSSREAEAGDMSLDISLAYMRPCLKMKKRAMC
jgi:hypothetical protein